MFLISKIVRGRRLLHELQHELQQEEETKKNSLSEKANNQVDHRNQRQLSIIAGGESSSPNAQIVDQNFRPNGIEPSHMAQRCLTCQIGRAASLSVSPSSKAIGCFAQPPIKDDANLRSRQTSQRRKKTTRQKTESSNDDENSSNILVVPARMRRTSSMPSVSDVPQHKISMQPRVRHYNYNARLNKLQKRSLRFTWQRLQTRNGGKKIEDVFNEVFERLMKQVPIMRDMFTTRAFLSAMSKNDVATLRDHARIIVRMFDLIIINLDKEPSKRTDTGSEFDPRLLGKAHGCLKPYRFTANIWEILGETIIDVVLCQEAVRDLPGAGQAWVVLTACVVDQLRAGFEHAREPYGVQQPSPIPTLPNMLPPKCPHMRSLEENHTVEMNLLSSQRENLKSRSSSIEQNSQPNWDETNERNGQNSSNFYNNAPRKTGRRLTDVNIQEENFEHLHKPKFSSTSATDRPLLCSRMSSRSSSSTKSQTQSLKQQSGF